jgi:hypothetical protein
METHLVSIGQVKPNENNPRIIKDYKFKKLVKSIQDFPQMLQLRPIVVNQDNVVLGGNMRLKACKEAGLKEVYIIQAKDLTEEQQREFIVKDNVGFGEWDWDILANQWDNTQLGEWGLDVWQPEEEVDYSALDDLGLDGVVGDMEKNVKSAIQIEFESEDYEEAKELVSKYRNSGAYIGGIILMYLREKSSEL